MTSPFGITLIVFLGLIGSKSKTIPVIFHLIVKEKEKNFGALFSFWTHSFPVCFALILFIDDDAAMNDTIRALDYSEYS